MPFTFASQRDRLRHFGRHGAEFGAATDLDYEALANTFLSQPKGARWPEILEAIRPREYDIIRYNYITNEFAVLSSTGEIRTFFKPDTAVHNLPNNVDYYLVNCVQT